MNVHVINTESRNESGIQTRYCPVMISKNVGHPWKACCEMPDGTNGKLLQTRYGGPGPTSKLVAADPRTANTSIRSPLQQCLMPGKPTASLLHTPFSNIVATSARQRRRYMRKATAPSMKPPKDAKRENT